MVDQNNQQPTGNGNGGRTPARVDNPFASEPIVAAPTGGIAQALVQREVAEVQAAMVIAQKFPRDPKASMDRILLECSRIGLAEKAEYQYVRGGADVRGPSIRLAEVLARQWGNMLTGVTELSRKNGVSEALAYAWDLETNYRDEKRFQVRHWRDTRGGGYAITDERDIYELIANMGARRKRACILAVIPGDAQEAALKQCDVTLKTQIEITPERIKSMIAKFEKFGVTQGLIEKRIQRRAESITAALMVSLGRIYNSLTDGMSQPEDWFDIAPASDAGEHGEEPETKTDSVKNRMRNRQQQAQAEPEGGGANEQTDAPASVDTETGEVIPQYDVESAIKALESKRNTRTLDELWDEIEADFKATGRELPLEITAKYDELREHLAYKEAQL